MRIAAATPRHIAGLAKLMAASPLLRRYNVTESGARASLRDAFRARDTLLVATDGDAIAGLAWIVLTRAFDRSAYLRLLLVAPRRRSQGLGAALLARGERDARAHGSRHLLLLVTRSNRRAREFYERAGYAHVGDLPGFARAGIAESLYVRSFAPERARGSGRSTKDAARPGSAQARKGKRRAR
jgi:ribosomal protein S18 acetylase RimI-like enzyme